MCLVLYLVMINVKILCCIFSAFSPTTALTHVSLYTSVVSGPDTTFYCTWAYQLLPMNIDADAGRRHTDVAIKYLNEVRCHSATTCTYEIPNKRPGSRCTVIYMGVPCHTQSPTYVWRAGHPTVVTVVAVRFVQPNSLTGYRHS